MANMRDVATKLRAENLKNLYSNLKDCETAMEDVSEWLLKYGWTIAAIANVFALIGTITGAWLLAIVTIMIQLGVFGAYLVTKGAGMIFDFVSDEVMDQYIRVVTTTYVNK